jgi:hypothetical protein
MKYRKTFREAWDETKLQSVNEQEEKQDSEEVRRLKDELQQMKVKYQQAKIDHSAPIPNPATGEVPLQVGIGHALLKTKDKKEADKKAAKNKSEKIEKLAKESLMQSTVNIIKESEVGDKAKSMGLDYMSFGRYGKKGKVTHKSIGGKLTAVGKDEKPIDEPKKSKSDDKSSSKAKIDKAALQKDLEDRVTDGMIDIDHGKDGSIDMSKEYEGSQEYEIERDAEEIKKYLMSKGISEKDIEVDIDDDDEEYMELYVSVKGQNAEKPQAQDSDDDKGVQPPEARKYALDQLNQIEDPDNEFDAYFDAEGDEDDDSNVVANAIDMLRDTGQEKLANDLEDIASDFSELEDRAQEKLDDFKDILKGKTPAVPAQIKKHEAVRDVYKQSTQDEISDYTKNTKNYLKSIAKVMDAGNVYSVDKGGPGLRQDQIATLQDSMETFKDVLSDLLDDIYIDENDPDSKVIDELQASVEFLEDDGDHDNYSKGGRITGELNDMIKVLNKFGLQKESYSPKNKFKEVLLRVEQKQKKTDELDIDDVANNSTKKKVKLSGKESKIEVNPNVDIGQISGGNKASTGNLH